MTPSLSSELVSSLSFAKRLPSLGVARSTEHNSETYGVTHSVTPNPIGYW